MRDTVGFDAFYHETSFRTLKRVFVLVGDAAEAEDIVQEAYLRAWQRWSRLAEYDDPEAWVRTVAWRLAVSRWRAARRWFALQVRLGPPRVVDEPSPDNAAIVSALRQLPPGQRQAVVLHHLCDLPVIEVAAQLQVPVGTVKGWLSRARAALAGHLAEHPPVCEVGDADQMARPDEIEEAKGVG